jgi:phosphopentomutase
LSYGPDRETMVKVKETLSSATPPHLMMVNLLGVDVNGHGNDWKKYLDNIKYTDAYTLEIWNAIQANPMLKDKTTLFITNDHGRHTEGHKNGFVNHGDGCDGCRHISLLVLGPDVPKNQEITTEAEMIDIPVTIAQMLHIGFPTGKGRFLSEIFKKKSE